MSTSQLKILLLGPPEVTLDGKPVLIKRRLNRALLFYLAAQAHPVTREQVCVLFWQDEPEEIARKNLREALSRIRTSLGLNDILISDGEQLSLNPDIAWVDYRELDKLISPLMNSTEMHSKATMPEWMVAQLKSGIALCRSNRFMQGAALNRSSGFENWLELTNQSYHYAKTKIIDRLVDHYISNGNLEEALIWLGKGIDTNPLDEDWNYLTLICLRDTGRIQELIDFATYLEGLYLQQEEKLPARFSDLKKDAITHRELEKATVVDWPEAEPSEAPFIGREDELETLNQALRRRGVVLVNGDAGIGKTRLLKQFFVSQPFFPRLFYCRAHPLGENVPFNAIVNPLRGQIQGAEWELLEPGDRELLDHFYHNILQGTEVITLPVPEGETLRVLENVFFAFLNFLKIAASRRPLLFIIDDAKWMDLASISLISFLIEQKFFDKYGLLVFAISPEVENPAIDALLQRTLRSRRLETINLEPLQDREVSLFIQRFSGQAPGDNFIRDVQRLSGGNPYFLVECLRTMKINLDSENFPGLDECSPPASILSLVKDKINGLEKQSAEVLAAAAILGRMFNVAVIEEVSGKTGTLLVACLDELIREGFIRTNQDDSTTSSYVFKHDVEREILLKRMGPAEKRHLHLKAAAALKKRCKIQPEYLTEVAMHLEATGEYERAVRAWLDAGRYARSRYSKGQTETAYGRALKLIDDSPAGFNETLIYNVVNEWGNYTIEHDDAAMAENIFNCCMKAADAHRSAFLAGTAFNGLARVFELTNDFSKAEKCLKQAEFYLSQTDHQVEKIKTLARLGNIHFGKDEYIQSISYFDKALQVQAQGNEEAWLDTRVNILTYLCAILSMTGEPEKAHTLAEEMVRDSMMVSRRSALLQARAVHSMTQYFSGRVEEAIWTCVDAHSLAEKLNIRFWCSIMDLMLAQAYLFKGNLDQCWSHLNMAARREEAFPKEKLSMHTLLIKGDVYRHLGSFESAESVYKELIGSGEKNYQTITSRYLLGLVYFYEGITDSALRQIEEGIREAVNKGLSGVALEARMTRLILTYSVGSVERFKNEGIEILEDMNNRGILNRETYTGWFPAAVAELDGNNQAALEHYLALQARLATAKNVWSEFQVLRRIIVLSGDTGNAAAFAKKRADDLLSMLASTATFPEVKGPFLNFRKHWRKNVNDMSTPILYKNKH